MNTVIVPEIKGRKNELVFTLMRQNEYGGYSIVIRQLDTFKQAEQWAIDNGYTLLK